MMLSRRQQIIHEITELEQVVHFQQKQVRRHEQYFIKLLHNPWLVQYAMLFPAFLLGWQIAKEKNPSRVIWFSCKLLVYITQAVQDDIPGN